MVCRIRPFSGAQRGAKTSRGIEVPTFKPSYLWRFRGHVGWRLERPLGTLAETASNGGRPRASSIRLNASCPSF